MSEAHLLRTIAASLDDAKRERTTTRDAIARLRQENEQQHRKTRRLIVEATVQVVAAVKGVPAKDLGRLRMALNTLT